jgi:Fe-S cluster biogenesis protein NfuA/nitrite reductase/ring-hydroxylating ferredoxin subunit
MDELVARVERLLEGVDERGAELVQALLDVYGEGLRRIVERVDSRELAEDELVSHLLMLHDLHPVPMETRVREALDGVRPYLESHGGDVELLGVDEDGAVRLRMHGSCHGCPSSTMTLKLAIEDAIQRAAPEVERIEAEGASEPAPAPALLQLEVSEALRGDWATVGSLPELRSSDTVVKEISGAALLFAEVGDNLYAYRASCAGCEGSLEGGELHEAELECPDCGRRYDVRRAGRCVDQPELSLEPIPLLTDDVGIAKVALPAGVA